MTEEKVPKLPTDPCFMCGKVAWYIPGDYYWGPRKPLCGVCHPHPDMEVKREN